MQTVSQAPASVGRPLVRASTSRRKKLLDRLQRELDASERTAPMMNSYQRIDPYIIETEQPGHTFSLIIYNVESELWYGHNKWKDNSFVHMHEHNVIRPGDVIFDIGCNAGFTTCWYALCAGPTGHVHAFDPFPWNAIATRYNAELNGLRHVTAHQVGIGAVEEGVTLSLYDAKISSRQAPHVVDAQIRPLSHYSDLNPDILKIDIEGAEYELSQTDFSMFDKLRFCMLELHAEFIEQRGLLPEVCMENFLRHGFEARHHLGQPHTIWTPSTGNAHGHYYLTRTSAPRAVHPAAPRPSATRPPAKRPSGSLLRTAFHSLPAPIQRAVRDVLSPIRTRIADVDRLRRAVEDRDVLIRAREDTIRSREAVTRERERTIAELEARLRAKEEELHALQTSRGQIGAGKAKTAVAAPGMATISLGGLSGAALDDLATAKRNRVAAGIRTALPAIDGWCTERKALWLADLIADNQCRRVLEIGIFGGKSLIPMAMAVKELAPHGRVYGVEAWSNAVAVETATNEVNDAWWREVDMQAIKAGFLRNLQANGLKDVVEVLEMPSDQAFTHLTSVDANAFDLIHVDGSHSEEQALRDVKTWSGLLAPGGILVLDDIGWPSVQGAREHLRSHLSVIEEVFESDGVAYGAYRRQP